MNDNEEYTPTLITDEEADVLLNSCDGGDNYRPLGKFYLQEGNKFVGIDNSDGCAWTEDFDTLEQCLAWLNDDGDGPMFTQQLNDIPDEFH